jgi:hypothetical protein
MSFVERKEISSKIVVVWIWKGKGLREERWELLSSEMDWWVWIMREMSASITPHVK